MNGDKTQIISHDYYSNCMIEAIKFKLRNFKNVKITVVAPWYNEVFCPHFLWSDGEYDYDFGYEGKIIPLLSAWTIHKGHIRRRRLGWNEEWKSAVMEYRNRRIHNETD